MSHSNEFIVLFEMKNTDANFKSIPGMTQVLKNDVRADNPNISSELDINEVNNISISIENVNRNSAQRIVNKLLDNRIGFNHQIVKSFSEAKHPKQSSLILQGATQEEIDRQILEQLEPTLEPPIEDLKDDIEDHLRKFGNPRRSETRQPGEGF